MKYLNFIIPIFLSFNSLSQEPFIRFNEFVPQWYHIAKDTKFLTPNISGLDDYTAFVNWVPLIEKDYTYSHFFSRNELGEMDGGLVQKIQNTNGSVEWSKMINSRHNYYQVSSQYILESSDTTITMVGMKRTNPNHNPFPSWGNVYGYAVPWIIEIDKRNGNIVREKVDLSDTLGIIQIIPAKVYFYNKRSNLIQLNVDSGKIKLSKFDNTSFNFIPFQYLLLNKIVSDSKIDGSTVGSHNINDSMFLISYYIKSKENDLSLDEASIEIYKLKKDTYDLTIKVNLLAYYKKRPELADPNENLYVISGKNKDYVIINSYQNPDNIFEYKNWLLWLDSTGKEKLFLQEINLTNSLHEYSLIKTIYLDSKNIYLAAFPSDNGLHGFDILKISSESKIEKSGTLTTNESVNNLRSAFFYANERGFVNMTVFWNRKYSATLGFHASDLGIDVSSNTSEYLNPGLHLIFAPNPANDETTFYINDEKYGVGMVLIYDLTGQKVSSQKISSGESLHTRSLPPGQYIVQYEPGNRPGYFLTSKLVKN